MNAIERVDATISYVRSFTDDPVAGGKGSMARLCAFGALAAGCWTTVQTVRFAFEAMRGGKSDVGMLGILAGLATTLFGTVCVGLLKRTTAGGVTETIDDTKTPPDNKAAVNVNVSAGAGQ